jgi:hypothetical protein
VRDAVERSNPKISVWSLGNPAYYILGQAIIG